MRIQYCSDLHLEFDHNSRYMIRNPLIVSGDILILAGDIVPLHDHFLNHSFFGFIASQYKKVFWIPGNHEFYHRDMAEFSSSYSIPLRSNIHIVHNVDLVYEGIRFVFSTLWSEISKPNEKLIENGVSDFECISNRDKKLKAAGFNKLHAGSLEFLRQALETRSDKTVVVTHHLPSSMCNDPAHKSSPINEAFCVDLTGFIESSRANFWIYGHSHFNQKPLYIGDTIVLTNQLGYVHHDEHQTFRHNAYLSL